MMAKVLTVRYDGTYICDVCDCRFAVDEDSGEGHKAVEFCPKCGEATAIPIDAEGRMTWP